VSRLTAQLETVGLVHPPERNDVRRNEDGRTRAVILSPAGAAAYKKGWPAYNRAVERHFARHLNEPAAVAVASAFERILNGAGEAISATKTDEPRME
jgi:hypothetical protein